MFGFHVWKQFVPPREFKDEFSTKNAKTSQGNGLQPVKGTSEFKSKVHFPALEGWAAISRHFMRQQRLRLEAAAFSLRSAELFSLFYAPNVPQQPSFHQNPIKIAD